MPPRKRNNRSYRRRRRTRSRLADKRINTLFEKRAKEIAIAEDNRNIQWFVNPNLIAKSGYTWDGLTNDPPEAQRLEVGSSVAPFAVVISEIGNTLANQRSLATAYGSQSNSMLIKNIQAHLRFQNRGVETVYVSVQIVSVPNSTDGGGTVTEPVLDYYSKTSIKYKGIFSPLQRTTEVNDNTGAQTTYIVDKTHTLLASRTFALAPARSLSGGNNNSTGYSTKQITLTKNYKRGKKVIYQYPNAGDPTTAQALPDENIVLWIQTSGQAVDGQNSVLVWGIAGCRYRLDQPIGRGKQTGNYTALGSVP